MKNASLGISKGRCSVRATPRSKGVGVGMGMARLNLGQLRHETSLKGRLGAT